MNLQPLKEARRTRKIKIQELAKTLDTTRITLGNYEAGRSVPTLEFAKRWAESLGIEIGFIQKI